MAEVRALPGRGCKCPREDVYPAAVVAKMDEDDRKRRAEYEAKRPIYWRGVIRENGGKP